jgi:hypothetical protein
VRIAAGAPPPRPAALVGLVLCVALGPAAQAATFAPVDDAATLAECGGCHLPFPPQLLPAVSWQAIMADLPRHFGEDASLPAALAAAITAYLVSHAGDPASLRGGPAPLRITATTPWLRRHAAIAPERFADPKVRSPANCQACHQAADRGIFGQADGR